MSDDQLEEEFWWSAGRGIFTSALRDRQGRTGLPDVMNANEYVLAVKNILMY
jgi:hypothetical protein